VEKKDLETDEFVDLVCGVWGTGLYIEGCGKGCLGGGLSSL
jgi:hypothetical protein